MTFKYTRLCLKKWSGCIQSIFIIPAADITHNTNKTKNKTKTKQKQKEREKEQAAVQD